MGLWCTTPKFGTRYAYVGILSTPPKNSIKLHTWGLAVHNLKIRDEVKHVWSCRAQLIKMAQSYARVDLWFQTPN